MKVKLVNSFEKRLIIYVLVSVLITIVSEFVLGVLVEIISSQLLYMGYRGEMMGPDGLDPKIKMIILVCLGFMIFVLSFYLMISKHMRYIKTITNSMKEIAQGNFDVTIPVYTVDEFGQIARYLNQMQKNIKVIMEKERLAEHTKNDLVSSVAHDLPTPLTSIIGYVGLVLDHPELDEEAKQKYLEIAFRKVQYLERLTNELFGFVKLEHQEMKMQLMKLDLRQLMEQLMNENYLNFEKSGLRTRFRCSDNCIWIMGDGNLLARLFENLLNNAMKYGKDGKMIIVEVEKKDSYASVKVINFGYVIPEEELEKLFQKFYRVEQSRSLHTGGSGLGLAIAAQIAHLHKGTIQVQSDLKGTVFEVRLPLETEEEIQ